MSPLPAEPRRRGARAARGWLGLLLLLPALASGYDAEVHQKLTFRAAKLFNGCVEETGLPALTPLQVRYIAKSSVALADSNFFVRLFRWNYYDRGGQRPRSLLWVISTRMHGHFDRLVESLEGAEDNAARYRELGGIVGYLQLMTSPARVVPVYTGRFWRWSFSDRFDTYRLDDEALEARLEDGCAALAPGSSSFQALLAETAVETLEAVRAPIPGLPATWEAFWKISDDPHAFGEYGPAGNTFGRRTSFACPGVADGAGARQVSTGGGDADTVSDPGRRCVLLKRDPIYAAFALERHAAAVRSTARAMALLQGWAQPRLQPPAQARVGAETQAGSAATEPALPSAAGQDDTEE